jgi:hypothetical protein
MRTSADNLTLLVQLCVVVARKADCPPRVAARELFEASGQPKEI